MNIRKKHLGNVFISQMVVHSRVHALQIRRPEGKDLLYSEPSFNIAKVHGIARTTYTC